MQDETPIRDQAQEQGRTMTDEQIKHMVNRFLSWKLPECFSPDGGICFKKTFNEHMDPPSKHEPSGTNLFGADQADAMVRYMIEGLPRGFETTRDADAERDVVASRQEPGIVMSTEDLW